MKALIVDSLPARCERLRALLAREAEVELLTPCHDGPAAVRAIETHRPDLVMMQVQLLSMSGFEVLQKAHATPPPVVIFMAEDDRHALEAFAAQGVDYLRWPFSNSRLREALQRARRHLQARRTAVLERRLNRVLRRLSRRHEENSHPRGASSYFHRVALKKGDRVVLLETREIDWVEAAGNYVCLHVRGHRHLLRTTLTEMERRLDPQRFTRVHRSRIVNAERVREMHPLGSGDCRLVLIDGTELVSSRTYSKARRQLFASLQ